MRGHTHDLSDRGLVVGCPECDLIVERLPLEKRERARDAMAKRYATLADKTNDKETSDADT